MNGSTIMWSVVFSSIGFGFFRYGRRQNKIIPYASGIALMAVPYVFESTWGIVICGLMLMALPYFVRY